MTALDGSKLSRGPVKFTTSFLLDSIRTNTMAAGSEVEAAF